MTKSELIVALSKKFPEISHDDTEMAVNEILAAISKTLSNLDRVEIRGFGSFVVNYRPPRIARNPKTGEQVNVEERAAPHFKAGLELKYRVNRSMESTIKLAA